MPHKIATNSHVCVWWFFGPYERVTIAHKIRTEMDVDPFLRIWPFKRKKSSFSIESTAKGLTEIIEFKVWLGCYSVVFWTKVTRIGFYFKIKDWCVSYMLTGCMLKHLTVKRGCRLFEDFLVCSNFVLGGIALRPKFSFPCAFRMQKHTCRSKSSDAKLWMSHRARTTGHAANWHIVSVVKYSATLASGPRNACIF